MGREVLVLIEQLNLLRKDWDILGFFDDGENPDNIIDGYPVLGGIDELNNWESPINVAIAIGLPQTKRLIVNKIKNELVSFPVLVHPSVNLGNFQGITIGEGSIITAGNVITSNVNIGKHVLINLTCTIGHDTNIEEFSSLMPGSRISGNVNIGQAVYIGTGAIIINMVNIGKEVTIGAGAVVVSHIIENNTVVGIPARPVIKV